MLECFECHLIDRVESLCVALTSWLEPVVSSQPPTQTQTDTLTKKKLPRAEKL